jgi:hypothetical protein
MTKIVQLVLTAIGILVFTVLLGDGPSRATNVQGGPESAGGVCHVVGGTNTGKTGTYDGDGSCCNDGPGGWGCTDCNGSNAGKCQDGPAKAGGVKPGTVPKPVGTPTIQKVQ